MKQDEKDTISLSFEHLTPDEDWQRMLKQHKS